MPSGPDQRPDLSGVPAELAPGRPVAERSRAPVASAGFRAKVRVAVWISIAMALLCVAGFLAYALPRLFGAVGNTAFDAAVEQPAASAPEPAASTPIAPDPQVLEVLDEYEAVMGEASRSSELARRQHAEAMKAVEAARALAKNPDSREARAAFDNAIREVQALSQEAERAKGQ